MGGGWSGVALAGAGTARRGGREQHPGERLHQRELRRASRSQRRGAVAAARGGDCREGAGEHGECLHGVRQGMAGGLQAWTWARQAELGPPAMAAVVVGVPNYDDLRDGEQ